MSAPAANARPVDRDLALRMVRRGASLSEIASRLGVSRADVMLAIADIARSEPEW